MKDLTKLKVGMIIPTVIHYIRNPQYGFISGNEHSIVQFDPEINILKFLRKHGCDIDGDVVLCMIKEFQNIDDEVVPVVIPVFGYGEPLY